MQALPYFTFHFSVQAKGVLFNNKPAEKSSNKVMEKEKEKEKDNKEKDSKEKDNKDSKEKESKEKAKPDKEKEKKTTPKPRLSVGAAAVSTEQSPKSDSSSSTSSNQPGTPKQRGRKPSVVKTPTESPSSTKTTPETQKPPSITENSPGRSPLPGLVSLPAAVPAVQSSTSLLMTPAKDTASVPGSVLVPEMLPKSVASQLQEMPQPSTSVLLPEIAKHMDIDEPAVPAVPAVTAVPKQTSKQTVTGNTSKKRAAPKASDEPKRKVGRPPIKKKSDTPVGVRKNSAHASQSNTVTSPLNTAFPSTFPQVSQGTSTSMPAFATFSNQNMFTGNSQGSSVPQNGPRTPSPNAYMIPQPRNRGLLENGHVHRPNNTSQAPL